ncbi:MAG: hypothetical protein KJ607_00180, partial [Bacteroidetes bacterium]|nr:hypothetical protein [Bacteroidota bacterium]
MKKRYLLIAAFLILLLTLTDIYVYKGVKLLAAGLPDGVRSFILYGFWCIFILFLAIVLIVLFSNLKGGRAGSQNLLFQVNGFLMLIFIPSLLFAGFHFLEDLLRLTLISVGI